jgi:hypothetical protein
LALDRRDASHARNAAFDFATTSSASRSTAILRPPKSEEVRASPRKRAALSAGLSVEGSGWTTITSGLSAAPR